MNELILEDTETARIYAAVVNALGDGATTEEVQAIVKVVQSVQSTYRLEPEELAKLLVDATPEDRAVIDKIFGHLVEGGSLGASLTGRSLEEITEGGGKSLEEIFEEVP